MQSTMIYTVIYTFTICTSTNMRATWASISLVIEWVFYCSPSPSFCRISLSQRCVSISGIYKKCTRYHAIWSCGGQWSYQLHDSFYRCMIYTIVYTIVYIMVYTMIYMMICIMVYTMIYMHVYALLIYTVISGAKSHDLWRNTGICHWAKRQRQTCARYS